MGDVVLGAVGFVGLVMILAAAAGLLVGLVVVIRKRLRDKAAGPTDPGHARLRSQFGGSFVLLEAPLAIVNPSQRAKFRRIRAVSYVLARGFGL